MSWPTDDLVTDQLDSEADRPPRAEFLKIFQRVKTIIAARGVANGIASLDENTRVPDAQIGRGVANGVASLDNATKVPNTQLHRGEANGVASLDENGKVPADQVADATLGNISIWQTGDVKWTSGTAASSGWLVANGAILAPGSHEGLRTFLGSRFKRSTDPDGTVRLPDLTGAFAFGADGTRPVGATGGAETHTLTIAEMPAHTHRVGGLTQLPNRHGAGQRSAPQGGGDSSSTGGSGPHNNMPPYVALLPLIKT